MNAVGIYNRRSRGGNLVKVIRWHGILILRTPINWSHRRERSRIIIGIARGELATIYIRSCRGVGWDSRGFSVEIPREIVPRSRYGCNISIGIKRRLTGIGIPIGIGGERSVGRGEVWIIRGGLVIAIGRRMILYAVLPEVVGIGVSSLSGSGCISWWRSASPGFIDWRESRSRESRDARSHKIVWAYSIFRRADRCRGSGLLNSIRRSCRFVAVSAVEAIELIGAVGFVSIAATRGESRTLG